MLNITTNTLPAILIGGPPHSGKSTFVYSLTCALRQTKTPHYVLRACPDGEGDWSNEADTELVRLLRLKGEFSPEFTDRIFAYLQKRHLPLLVDVGGNPNQNQQEKILGRCTHAILLVNDGDTYEQDLQNWRRMLADQNIPIIAELKSTLTEQDVLTATVPQIVGTIAGLQRGEKVKGDVFQAAVQKISSLFSYSEEELDRIRMNQVPVETILNLPRLAETLSIDDTHWLPSNLPTLKEYLPKQQPLGVYGRGPNWLYSFLSTQAFPAPFWLYDARLGWVQPPQLPLLTHAITNPATCQSGWQVERTNRRDYTLISMYTYSQNLDIDDVAGLPLLHPNRQDAGILLSGKVPYWLLIAAVRQLSPLACWLAVDHPPLNGAVVVATQDDKKPIGHVMART